MTSPKIKKFNQPCSKGKRKNKESINSAFSHVSFIIYLHRGIFIHIFTFSFQLMKINIHNYIGNVYHITKQTDLAK